MDKYLISDVLSVSDSAECVALIQSRFQQEGAAFFNERATAVNSVLFFAYMCQYITYEELCIFLGDYFASARIRQTISGLCNDKLLRKEAFRPADGLSRYGYCLTRNGIDYLLPLLPPHLSRNIKVRRSGSIVPSHDYYTGINLFHFFVSGYSFSWSKEVVYHNRLRPDAVLTFKDAALPSTIYIEEDMGTEDKGTLLDKLSLYRSLSLMDDSMVIYSMGAKRTAPAATSGLSKKFLLELLTYLEMYRIRSVFRFYEFLLMEEYKGNRNLVPERFLSRLEEFLVWTGICRAAGRPASEMRTANVFRIGHNDITCERIKEMVSSYSLPNNPFVQQYLNRGALIASFHKYLGLLSVVFYYINTAEWNSLPYIASLFMGYPVYVLPTMLLSNYFKDMFHAGSRDDVFLSLKSYYPMLTRDMYHVETELFYLDINYPAVRFKEAYAVGNGLVIVSSAYNMATLSQILLCSSIARSEKVGFLHFVLLVDEYEHALALHKLLNLPSETTEMAFTPRNAFVSVSYMLRSEVGKEERLFGIYSYQSFSSKRTVYEPRYLLPRIYDSEKHPDIVRKQFSGFYEVAGYTDMEESVREYIKAEIDDMGDF